MNCAFGGIFLIFWRELVRELVLFHTFVGDLSNVAMLCNVNLSTVVF